MRIAKAGHEGPKASSAVTATDDSRSATGVSRRQAYAMWGMGMAGYLFAITCRSSFAASGIVAAQHFGVSSAALSSFVYLQLLMYAIMQIPAASCWIPTARNG
jgi:hypothetical protein